MRECGYSNGRFRHFFLIASIFFFQEDRHTIPSLKGRGAFQESTGYVTKWGGEGSRVFGWQASHSSSETTKLSGGPAWGGPGREFHLPALASALLEQTHGRWKARAREHGATAGGRRCSHRLANEGKGGHEAVEGQTKVRSD